MIRISEIGAKAATDAEKHIAEMKAQGKVINKSVPLMDWGEDVLSGKSPLKEMISTDDGAEEFLQKTTFDLYQGRELVPLVYKDIYTTLVDANFPEALVANEFGPIEVVFLEKLAGGEVSFGALAAGTQKVVKMHTYAAGIEYDEDMVEYNQTWRVTEIGMAFGEAYNKLLNHLHMYPIINGTYTTTGGGLAAQKAAQNASTPQLVAYDTSVEKTLRNAMSILPKGSKIIANSSDQYILEDAIFGSLYSDGVTPSAVRRKFKPEDITYYDGDEATVGGKTYPYAGVTAGTIFILVPKLGFREYVKHELRVDQDGGDISRLILAQVVARTRRSVLASLATKNGVIKVDISA